MSELKLDKDKIEAALKKCLPAMADMANKWFETLPLDEQVPFYKESLDDAYLKLKQRNNKIKALEAEAEKELVYFKAIYNPLIDGAARDTDRINELEKKLEIAVKALEMISFGTLSDNKVYFAHNALKEISEKDKA